MLFNSLHFLIFFPIVTAGYFLLPARIRWAWLLAASCYFYMAFRPVYILILVFTIAVDYTAGIRIERAQGTHRKWWLIASLVTNVGVLCFFKYFNFLNGILTDATATANLHNPVPFLNIVLPIGLSFHVFQSMSYTIEVYRGHQPAERHLGILSLYVMYYPQLVAGPIERPQNLLHQLREAHPFESRRVVAGIQLMMFGFFKKIMIADRLAPFVNQVYDDPHSYAGISLIIATVCFAFQIYCDFSGYSDIALGSSQVMGITLMKNFNCPYFSKSIAEFWKRWHISLSTWFRDYLYISLGGNRVARPRWYFNLFITFLISGLWHGANWTYVIWGALNGVYLIVEIFVSRSPLKWILRRDVTGLWKWPLRSLQVGITFTLVCAAWVLFRARTLTDATYIYKHMFDNLGELRYRIFDLSFVKMNILLRQDKTEFLVAVLCVSLLLAVHWLQREFSVRALLAEQPVWLRWGVYYATIAGLVFYGAFNSSQQFIYFQF